MSLPLHIYGMANIYLRSTDGSDVDDGSTWALAKATLGGAFAVAAAGDTIYVSQVHAETQATTMTITSPGTAASPVRILCGNDGAEPPTALATTATITTTGASAITFNGYAYVYGITFSVGTGNNTNNLTCLQTGAGQLIFDSCLLKITNTSTSSRILFGASEVAAKNVYLVNTPLGFSSTSQLAVVQQGELFWRDTPNAINNTVPTILFSLSGSIRTTRVTAHNLDLSAAGSGKSIVGVAANVNGEYLFENCKLGSSVSLTSGTHAGPSGITARFVNCDSADTNYKYNKISYQGEISTETVIVRTSGASDGTTPISRKLVSSADSKFFTPLETDTIAIWNETTGSSLTATVEIVNDGVTLKDDEIWLELSYSSDASFPKYSTLTDRATDILTAGTNQTTSSVTWTTTGLSSPTKQKLEVTFTPLNKGLIIGRVCLAKASQTVYVCLLMAVA